MKVARIVAGSVGIAMIGWACAKVPYTGRKQYNLVPEGIMKNMGRSSYARQLRGVSVQRDGADANMLSQVGRRISNIANEPNYDWSYALIEDDVINAWCLPGGYIGFYTAILPVLESEAGMAFVMGHEVGHATARHGSERMTQQLTLIGGLGALTAYLQGGTDLSTAQKAAIVGAIGLGAEVGVILPFSRKHESEADIIGMMYASGAGYPPGEGIEIWDRMQEASGPSAVPVFLSTHPGNARRQAVMREWMPQAEKRFERNRLPHNTEETLWDGPVRPVSTPTRREAPPQPTRDASGGSSDGGMTRPDR
ncbi:MAG: putative Zn-dependent protease [Myxococcota bacterium]|jgi:predicted Zn-dependent protease